MSDFPEAQELRLAQLCQCVFCNQFRLIKPSEMSAIEQQTAIVMGQVYDEEPCRRPDPLVDYPTEN